MSTAARDEPESVTFEFGGESLTMDRRELIAAINEEPIAA